MHSGGRSDEKHKNHPGQKKVTYHPEAYEELKEAALYYDSCKPDLGTRFLTRIDSAVNFICHNSQLFRADNLDRRRYIVKKFPFLLIYKVEGDVIFILAVAHAARKPGYWKSRDIR